MEIHVWLYGKIAKCYHNVTQLEVNLQAELIVHTIDSNGLKHENYGTEWDSFATEKARA